jgi:hypothetical protein
MHFKFDREQGWVEYLVTFILLINVSHIYVYIVIVSQLIVLY